jgi:hypothetical protein
VGRNLPLLSKPLNTIAMTPFDLNIWLKDKSRRVVTADGRNVKVFPIGLAPEFYPFVPKGIDPTTCCTYHAQIEGERNAPVLCGGPSKILFFAD